METCSAPRLQLHLRKKGKGGHLCNERVIVHCFVIAQILQIFFQNQSLKWTGKGRQVKEKCGYLDLERRKQMKI